MNNRSGNTIHAQPAILMVQHMMRRDSRKCSASMQFNACLGVCHAACLSVSEGHESLADGEHLELARRTVTSIKRSPVDCCDISGAGSSTWNVVSSLDSCISACQIRHAYLSV